MASAEVLSFAANFNFGVVAFPIFYPYRTQDG
jgi:hypothetical protein